MSPVRCNCKKSRCLKLYCECFARGTYGHMQELFAKIATVSIATTTKDTPKNGLGLSTRCWWKPRLVLDLKILRERVVTAKKQDVSRNIANATTQVKHATSFVNALTAKITNDHMIYYYFHICLLVYRYHEYSIFLFIFMIWLVYLTASAQIKWTKNFLLGVFWWLGRTEIL